MASQHKKAARHEPLSVWKSAPIALGITVGLSLLLLLLFSKILLATKDPVRYTALTGPVLLYFCTAFGGYLASLLCGRRFALLSGLLVGAGTFFFCTVCALFIKSEASHLAALLLRLPLLAAAICGALLATKKRKARRRKRK